MVITAQEMEEIMGGEISAPKALTMESGKKTSKTKSPLSFTERIGWGTLNPKAQDKYLKDTFGEGNYKKIDGKYHVKNTKGEFKPVDPKGFEAGDVAEAVPKAIVSMPLISAPLDIIRQKTGNIITGIEDPKDVMKQVAGAAIETVLPTYGQNKRMQSAYLIQNDPDMPRDEKIRLIKEVMEPEILKNIDKGEVALEGIFSLIPLAGEIPAVKSAIQSGKAMLSKPAKAVVSNVGDALFNRAKREVTEEGIEAITKTFGKEQAEQILKKATKEELKDIAENIGTDQAKIVADNLLKKQTKKLVKESAEELADRLGIAKTTVGDKFADLLGRAPGDIGERIVRGESAIGGRAYGRAADAAENGANKIISLYKDIGEDLGEVFYKSAGITNDLAIDSKPILKAAREKIEEVTKRAIDKDSKAIIKTLDNLVDSLDELAVDGKLNYGQVKRLQKEIYGKAKGLLEKDPTLGQDLMDVYGAVAKARDEIPELAKATKGFKEAKQGLEELETIFKDTTRAQGAYEGKILSMVDDMKSKVRLKKMEKFDEFLKNTPGLEKYSFMPEVNATRDLAWFEKNQGKALLPQAVKNIPFIGKAAESIAGLAGLDVGRAAKILGEMGRKGLINEEMLTKEAGERGLAPAFKALKAIKLPGITETKGMMRVPGAVTTLGRGVKEGLKQVPKAVPMAEQQIMRYIPRYLKGKASMIQENIGKPIVPMDIPTKEKKEYVKGMNIANYRIRKEGMAPNGEQNNIYKYVLNKERGLA